MIDCISFDSYIKPQLIIHDPNILKIVYLLIPTSNHNSNGSLDIHGSIVYLLIPTSNHNTCLRMLISLLIVYLLIPTSNHNSMCIDVSDE